MLAVLSSCSPLPATESMEKYNVGDVGPGGGVVFYKSDTPFPCSTGNCHYLEVSPASAEVHRTWSYVESFPVTLEVKGATGSGMGNGYTSSADISNHPGSTSETSAAVYALEYELNGVHDWFLPSLAEMDELCKFAHSQPTGDLGSPCRPSSTLLPGFGADRYWTSSEDIGLPPSPPMYDNAWSFDMLTGLHYSKTKNYQFRVRPIRAF